MICIYWYMYIMWSLKAVARQNFPILFIITPSQPILSPPHVSVMKESYISKYPICCTREDKHLFTTGAKYCDILRDYCNSSRWVNSTHRLIIFSWDSPKFSNFKFFAKQNFQNMSAGLVKINCYKYPWY